MKRILKWAAISLVALVAAAASGIYSLAEYRMRQRFDVPLADIAVSRDSAAVARGAHVAQLRGCTDCHKARLEGGVFFDDPKVARLVAPNLTQVAARYSDAELARAIRHGVRANGTGLVAMPSRMLFNLSDRDLADLIAWIRSHPVVENDHPENELRFAARLGVALDKFKLEPRQIDHAAARIAPDSANAVAFGRYLARTSCTECHGANLEGGSAGPYPTPSLMVVAAYSEAEFRRLMREGVPRGEPRDLGLMKQVALSRFAHLTEQELVSLYAYLRTLAPGPVATTAQK